jgi:hypothetical protein
LYLKFIVNVVNSAALVAYVKVNGDILVGIISLKEKLTISKPK